MKKYFLYILISLSTTLTAFSQEATNKKIGNDIKFNVEFGGVVNSPFCNVSKVNSEISHFSSTIYYNSSPHFLKAGLHTGFNFIFGHKKIKAIFGCSYLQSNCEFDYYNSYSQLSQGNTYITNSEIIDINYKGIIHYVTMYTGMRIYIKKWLNFEIDGSFNEPFYYSTRAIGNSETQTTQQTGPNTFEHSSESINYNGSIQHQNLTDAPLSFSFKPKLIYSFLNNEKPYEIYIARNLGVTYKQPWWMIGVTYYPFKKLR